MRHPILKMIAPRKKALPSPWALPGIFGLLHATLDKASGVALEGADPSPLVRAPVERIAPADASSGAGVPPGKSWLVGSLKHCKFDGFLQH
jgi:hypothetical protein